VARILSFMLLECEIKFLKNMRIVVLLFSDFTDSRGELGPSSDATTMYYFSCLPEVVCHDVLFRFTFYLSGLCGSSSSRQLCPCRKQARDALSRQNANILIVR